MDFYHAIRLFFTVMGADQHRGFTQNAFDPYPLYFLNLLLSMLAAIQAPIIAMSQNRQSKRDRLDAGLPRGQCALGAHAVPSEQTNSPH